MNRQELIRFYAEREDQYRNKLVEENTTINGISNLRLISALAVIATVYFGTKYPPLFILTLFLIILFAYLVQKHAKHFAQKVHLENLVRIHEMEVKSLQGDDSLLASGKEFINPVHPYTHDLDIFGDGSVFQHVNRCNTLNGKARLANQLSAPLLDHVTIREYQDATRELSAKYDFRHDFQAAGMEIEESVQDRTELLRWLRVPSFVYGNSTLRIAIVALPILTLISIFCWAFFGGWFKPVSILFVFVQWTIFGVYAKRVQAFHEYISRKKNILDRYAHLLHYFNNQKFSSSLMVRLSEAAKDADKKVANLANLVTWLNARLNFLTAIVVNSVFLYDLQCLYRLEKWKSDNASQLEKWLNAVSDTEVLCSLGNFAFNHPSFVFPQTHESLYIEGTALGHPLLQEEECVTNDMLVGKDQSILVITGANMAGKSTFLRTLGVNLVLALAGAPVCARKFVCPIVPLRSGMRTADSLKDHASYFYAELNRLKAIMDELRSGRPLFILLDEILKGTNSGDKQRGSLALVKQLVGYPCLGVIATHDLALGDLELQFPNHIRNYCFEPNIENDQLSFDYLLKPGVAQKMNATFLMKKMGIIPSDATEKEF